MEKNTQNYKFFQHKECEMFPCHQTQSVQDFNCLFCYCPLYVLGKECGGNFTYTEKGIKSCINCDFPHQRENYEKINSRFKDIVKKM